MTDAKQTQIKELALFRSCRAAEVRWIAGVADAVDLPAGRPIVRQGQSAREFVVVIHGAAVASDGRGDVILAPGAFFGEMGLLDGTPHACNVETLTPTRLLVFDARAFRGMLDRLPSVARTLLGELVQRLRVVDQDPRSLRAVS